MCGFCAVSSFCQNYLSLLHSAVKLGENCFQILHLWRYIGLYTVEKFNFMVTCENFENDYPHSNALLKFHLKLEL